MRELLKKRATCTAGVECSTSMQESKQNKSSFFVFLARVEQGGKILLFIRFSITAISPGFQRPSSFTAARGHLPSNIGAHCRSPLSRLHPPSPCPPYKQASNSLRRGDVWHRRVGIGRRPTPSDTMGDYQVGAPALRLASNARHRAFPRTPLDCLPARENPMRSDSALLKEREGLS